MWALPLNFSAAGTFNGAGLLATAGTAVNGWATTGGTDWAVSNGTQIAGFSTVGGYLTTASAGATAGNYLAASNVDVTSGAALSGAVTVNSLRFNQPAANTLTLTGANALASGGILVTGNVAGNASLITGGTLEGASGQDLVVIQNNTAGALTIGSTITNNGTATGLTKSGGGLLVLTANNPCSGLATVSAGTLQIGNNTNATAAVAGRIVLNGGTLDYNYNAANYAINGNITLAAPSTFGNISNNQINLGGTFYGAGQILTVNNGTSTAPLFFNQTFGSALGQLNIVQGLVAEDSSGGTPLRNAAIVISNGAAFTTFDAPTVNNNFTLNGGSGLSSGGVIYNVAGTGTPIYTGTISLSSGTSSIGGAGNLTINGALAGSGGLTKIGAGTMRLAGSNGAFTGPTTVSAGVLTFAQQASLYGSNTASWTPGNISVAPGATLALGVGSAAAGYFDATAVGNLLAGLAASSGNTGFQTGAVLGMDTTAGNATFTGAIGNLSGGNVVNVNILGPNTLTLAGNSTYTGTTTLSGGIVNVGTSDTGSSGPLGKSGPIVLAGATLQYSASNQYDYSGRFSTAANQAYNVDTNGQSVTWASGLTSTGGALTKLGSGMLTLSGPNSYTGATTISNGTLSAASIVPSGGTSSLGNFTAAVVLGGAATQGTLLYTGPSTAYTNGLTVNAGGGQLINAGGGTLSIASVAVNTAGPLAFGGASGNDINLSSTIGGTGGLVKTGADTLTVSGTSNYSGATTITAGTLRLQLQTLAPASGSAMWLNASQGFTVSGNTTTWLDQSSNGNNAVNTAGTGPTLTTSANGINGLPVINFNGTNQYLAGGLAGSNSATTSLTFFIVHKDANLNGLATYLSPPGWTTGPPATTQFLHSSGVGNKFQYSVNPNADRAGATYTISTNVPEVDEVVNNNGQISLYVNGNSNGTFNNSASQAKFLGVFDIGAWASSGTNPTANLTRWFGGSIGEILIYDSALSTTNRQAVESYLDSKWLNIGTPPTANFLPTGTALSVAASSTFDLNGVSQQVASLSNYSGGGGNVINSGSSPVVLSLSPTGGSTTFSGLIQGGGTLGVLGLALSGNGVQILAGANSYTGSTSVTAGTLAIAGSGSLGGGVYAGNIALGGSAALLNYNSTAAQTFSGVLSGSGALANSGPGMLTLSGSNIYTGATTISGGTLQLAGSSAAMSSSVAVNVTNGLAFAPAIGGFSVGGLSGSANFALLDTSGGSVSLSVGGNSANSTFSGVMSGSGQLAKNGSGRLTLSNSSTYTGGTTVGGGTLQLGTGQNGQDGSIGNTSGVVNNAALVYNLYGNQTAGYAISGSGSVTKAGPGSLVISASNNYTGPTVAAAGTLGFSQQASLYGGNTASWTPANVSVAPGATLALGVGSAAAGYFDATAVTTLLTGLSTSSGTAGLQSGAILGLDTTAGNFTYGGTIANPGGNTLGLTILGSNTLTLAASNTYTGATTLSTGVVNLARATRGPRGPWATAAQSSLPAAHSSIQPPTSTTIQAASPRPPIRLTTSIPTGRTSPGQLP